MKIRDNTNMIINYVRAIILYLVVLFVTRLMGKREIAELQPFEFVISLMIANLATIPMSDTQIPIINGIIPIMGLLTMHLLFSLFSLKSLKFRELVCGKPKILVHHGIVDEKALEKERFTIADMEEKLREKDIFDLQDVEYVIMETNGELSVILKPEKQNVTREDLQINADDKGIIYNLILDGKIIDNNLKLIGKNEIWLKNKIKENPKDILFATIDEQGNIFYQKKRKDK